MQRSRFTLIAAALESAYGQDSHPTLASNGQLILANIEPVALGPSVFDSHPVRQTFSRTPSLVRVWSQRWRGETFLQGSGAAGVTAGFDALLRCCQMSSATQSGVSVTYSPTSQLSLAGSPQSATIYTWLDGLLHRMTGCVGDFSVHGRAGESICLGFALRGLYSAPSVLPNPSGFATGPYLASYSHPSHLKIRSTLSAQYFFPEFIAFNFDEGLKIAERTDVSTVAGVKGFVPVSRTPQLRLVLEADFVNRNFYPELEQGALLEAYFSQGSVIGNIATLGFPSLELTDITYGDLGGVRTCELALSPVTTAATEDSEFFLQFS